MTIWIYTLENNVTGSVRAADDDQAWTEVLSMVGQCPISLSQLGANVDEVAA